MSKPRRARGRGNEPPAGAVSAGHRPIDPRAGGRPRIASLLGFAVKAGRVTPGVALTRKGLTVGSVRFVVLAADLSERRRERIEEAARTRGVGIATGWTQAELGALLGRGPTGAVGVTDASLARGMDAAAGRAV